MDNSKQNGHHDDDALKPKTDHSVNKAQETENQESGEVDQGKPRDSSGEERDENSGLLDNDPTLEDAYDVDDYDPDAKEHRNMEEEEQEADDREDDQPEEKEVNEDKEAREGRELKEEKAAKEEKAVKPGNEPLGEDKKEDNKEDKKEDAKEDDQQGGEQKGDEQKVNYELLSKQDLVGLLEEKMNSLSFNQLRGLFGEISDIFERKTAQEREVKQKAFLAQGGNEEDFRPVEDPADQQMRELTEKYRSLKADFNKQLEQSKEQNLKEKESILEEFRLLMEGQDTFENTFRNFKKLQKRWFDIGIVPQQNVRDLWNSYNFFVDKFNDYVKINRELRALDLKKNLDLKEKLCEKAEALADEKNVVAAFKTLQKYHAQWRDIGPVPREEKDNIWERFKKATSVINKAHQAHQAEMRESLVKNLEAKEILCERAEGIAAGDYQSHKEWANKTNELLAIQEEWKLIGYAPKKHNNQIYSRFRKACDAFFDRKAGFYAKTFEHQKENLKEKEAIIAEAEQLKDSTDWKETTNRMIALQKKWKEIGPVPRRDSEKQWKRFRAACDHFFNEKARFHGAKDENYEENLKEKEALLEEMRQYDPKAEDASLIRDLDSFQERYNEIGFVPIAKKDRIRDDFRNEFSNIIDRTSLSEKDKSILMFRIRMLGVLSGPKSHIKLRNERDRLFNKLQQLKNDISVLENNIGFFKDTESAEDTISGFQDKLAQAHERIGILEGKLSVLDDLESEGRG